ncbi:isochorismatase family protein [Crenobacter sp. SG2303]|uniref:Isochorismatase family protein n=1 Tax=Crenobacter oryzisoli TaxID=3056844 RepID=A0ABT7XI15_9NEIS|nr:isochorismatase family protein [Crenobacter sp. SG2303]MDN0073421.1 isochorismatase family protein [Crenobacter sp. SG2303]
MQNAFILSWCTVFRASEWLLPGLLVNSYPLIQLQVPMPMTTALLIIDVQQALCSGEEAAFDSDRVIASINALGAKARADLVPVILVQHEEDAGLLQFGSNGWQLDERLTAQPEDFRVGKTTPDSFHQTELHSLLQQWGANHLVICGLQSDFCVDSAGAWL